MKAEFGIIICEQTVRRRLHEAGFKDRVERKKQYVDKTNPDKTYPLCKKISRAASVLWTDESKFNLFGPDGRVMVRRKHSIPDAWFPPLNTDEEM